MKKVILIVLFNLFALLLFAQVKQGTLIDDAHYFKRMGDYAKSLELLKQAFKSKCHISDEYYYAVKVALLNNNDHLAFKWLNDYTKIDSYRSVNEIATDSAFLKLHSDVRWNTFLSMLQKRNNQREKRYNKQLKKELDQLYFDDQDIRIKYVAAYKEYGPVKKSEPVHPILDSLMNVMVQVDSINLIKVSNFLNTYGWPKISEVGERGNTALFGALQHAPLKTQQKYYSFLEKAFKEGRLPALLYSEFVDRVLLREGKKQLYGNQYSYKPNSMNLYVQPLVDPENVDERRLQIGLGHFAYFLQGQGLTWDVEEYKRNMPQYEKWSATVRY
jgi:hypothetical protein